MLDCDWSSDVCSSDLTLTVFVAIAVTKHSRENASSVHAHLSRLPGVVSCHMVSGDADFLAEIVVPDLAAYERLLTQHILTLPMIENVRSNFSLRAVCVQQPLTLPP
jgi:Lrp/AsnC family leucine-responsive transcriptional regulator